MIAEGTTIGSRNSRALVIPGSDTDEDRRSRPAAQYVAQLIATKLGFPQTRARRRTDPREATAIYDAQESSKPRLGRYRVWRLV